jgi:hypothetical protein
VHRLGPAAGPRPLRGLDEGAASRPLASARLLSRSCRASPARTRPAPGSAGGSAAAAAQRPCQSARLARAAALAKSCCRIMPAVVMATLPYHFFISSVRTRASPTSNRTSTEGPRLVLGGRRPPGRAGPEHEQHGQADEPHKQGPGRLLLRHHQDNLGSLPDERARGGILADHVGCGASVRRRVHPAREPRATDCRATSQRWSHSRAGVRLASEHDHGSPVGREAVHRSPACPATLRKVTVTLVFVSPHYCFRVASSWRFRVVSQPGLPAAREDPAPWVCC